MDSLRIERVFTGASPSVAKAAFTTEQAHEAGAKWQSYGHKKVEIKSDAVWITLAPNNHIQVRNQEIAFDFHDDGHAGDQLARDVIRYIKDNWDGSIKLFGNDGFKLLYWHHAESHGIKVVNYTPPSHLKDPIIF